MLITIRNPRVLAIFGWKTFPSYVTASHKLWWHWWRHGVKTGFPGEAALSKHKIEL